MHIQEIHLLMEEGRSVVPTAFAEPGAGLRGGAPPKKPDREISMIAGELLPGLRGLGGLCTGHFDADIVTSGLDYARLEPGDRLKLGEVIIELTAVGKRCFDDCPIRLRGERCPLPDSCAFARVRRSGDLAIDDGITILRCDGDG